MSYDESVAARLRKALPEGGSWIERKMFGGLAFLWQGHMVCGVLQDRVVLRLGDARAAQALRKPHVSAMDFTGTAMKSMVYLHPPAYSTPARLRGWLVQALTFAQSLPAKPLRPRKKK